MTHHETAEAKVEKILENVRHLCGGDYMSIQKFIRSQSSHIHSLEAKLKIARGALENANTAFSNILRDKEYESFTLEDFKFHMKASMFLCKSMIEETEKALSQLSL